MKHVPVPRFGLAIDWETTGYTPIEGQRASKHQGISFGAVIFEIATLNPIDTIYHEIKFDPKYTWSNDAERVHGLSREHLEKHGITQTEAAVALGNLVMKYINTDKIVALGHRVAFDIEFTQQLMGTIGVELDFDPIKIDSAAIALTFLNVQSSDELFSLCGMPERKEHNSLEDILYTLESIKAIKAAFLGG